MSTYKQIAGTTVKAYTTNPSDPQEGEMWYNQTTLKLRGVTATAAFSSASPTTTPREGAGGFGIQTAAVIFGGETPSVTNKTEEYNGSGWTAGGNLNTARYRLGGAGTLTAGLAFGGYISPSPPANQNLANTEEYDGTSWTTGGDLNTGRHSLGSGGTQTSALGFGGSITGGTLYQSVTEEYNGTSWTEVSDLNTGRQQLSGAGANAEECLAFGGYTSSPPTVSVNNTESWDGTSWTEVNNLNTARHASDSGGTQTSAIMIGGFVGPGTAQSATETWDGTNWTTSPATLATARARSRGGGTTSAFVTATGQTPSITTAAEEFNFSAQVITAAAWASGGNLSTGRQRAGGFGNAQNSAAVAAGATAPPASALSATEEYDGSAWSSGGSVNTARYNMTAFGTETAGVLSGKGTPSVPYAGTTEEYDGSSWTTVTSYSSPNVNYRSSCGPETAGLLAGGVRAPGQGEFDNVVEEYDGSTWTSGTALPQYQSYNNQAGTQTAAINGGGSAGPAAPGPVSANTISLEYDGTNWTTAPNANLAGDQVRSFNGGTGTQSDAMFVGGDENLNGIRYDGTTFRTDAAYPAVRGETSAAGLAPASTATIFAGAPVPSVGNTTLEYSAESTSVNSVDITTAE